MQSTRERREFILEIEKPGNPLWDERLTARAVLD
jgi:hypothetical protein